MRGMAKGKQRAQTLTSCQKGTVAEMFRLACEPFGLVWANTFTCPITHRRCHLNRLVWVRFPVEPRLAPEESLYYKTITFAVASGTTTSAGGICPIMIRSTGGAMQQRSFGAPVPGGGEAPSGTRDSGSASCRLVDTQSTATTPPRRRATSSICATHRSRS